LLHCRSKADSQEIVALRENGHDDCCLIVQTSLQPHPLGSYWPAGGPVRSWQPGTRIYVV
jgi:hypothetical protein